MLLYYFKVLGSIAKAKHRSKIFFYSVISFLDCEIMMCLAFSIRVLFHAHMTVLLVVTTVTRVFLTENRKSIRNRIPATMQRHPSAILVESL